MIIFTEGMITIEQVAGDCFLTQILIKNTRTAKAIKRRPLLKESILSLYP